MQPPDISNAIRETLGLEGISDAERDAVLADIGEVLYSGVMRRAWNSLDLKKQDEFAALLAVSADAPEDEAAHVAVQHFIEANVPDFERFVSEEVAAFKDAHAKAESELAEK